MPIWFELIALSLAAYAVGLLLGWIVWGREAQPLHDGTEPTGPETPTAETRSTT